MSIRKVRVRLLRLGLVPIVALCVMVVPSRWPDGVAHFALRSVGYLLLICGVGLRLWSGLYVGRRRSRLLVTEGPYSICRNPLYLGTFAIALGAAFCFENLLMGALVLAFIIPVHVAIARAEQRHLEKLFPQDYQEYRRSVPAFIPSLRRFKGSEQMLAPGKVSWRKAVDLLLVLLIPQFADLAQLLHRRGCLPVLWRFP